MVSQFGKECFIQYIRGPLGGSRFPWKKKIFLYHLNHSVILEKCYIKITLTNYLCKINKLQTIPLFFSVILQVKDTDINGYLHYLDFRYVCVNVCVCVWGWGEGGEGGRMVLVKNICIPHASQVGVTSLLPTKDLWETLYQVARVQSWIEFWSSIISSNYLKFWI